VEAERQWRTRERERGAAALEMKQETERGIWAAWWAGPDYFLLLLLSFSFFLFVFLHYLPL